MRSSLVLTVAVALLLGSCIAEPRVRSAAVPPAATPPASASPTITPPTVVSSTIATPVVAPPASTAPTVAAPAASTLCGGLSGADAARCQRVVGQEVARISAAEAGEMRGVMKQVALRQAQLDDPGRPVRCGETTVDGQLVMTCTATPRR